MRSSQRILERSFPELVIDFPVRAGHGQVESEKQPKGHLCSLFTEHGDIWEHGRQRLWSLVEMKLLAGSLTFGQLGHGDDSYT